MNRAYAVIAGGFAVAAALFVAILLGMPAQAQTDLVVEVAKAAIGLFPVVFFGVIVAELLKRRDEERSRRENRREERRAFRERAIAGYNASKSVRRYLRGAGFGPRVPPRLGDAMLATLDEQMRALSTAQLQGVGARQGGAGRGAGRHDARGLDLLQRLRVRQGIGAPRGQPDAGIRRAGAAGAGRADRGPGDLTDVASQWPGTRGPCQPST